MHRLDRINAKKPAKLLDFKSLTLGFRSKQIWQVFLCDTAKWQASHSTITPPYVRNRSTRMCGEDGDP